MSDQELYGAFQGLGKTLGLKGHELEVFAAGRDGPPEREGFDGMVDSFRGMGLSAEGARVAAIGHHGDERGAREVFDTSGSAGGGSALHTALDGLCEAYERFHGCTRAEAVQMAKGEAARVIVTYNLTADAAAGRLREFATSLNAARPGAGAPATPPSTPAATAAAADPKRLSAATVAWHRDRERIGALRRAGVTD